MNLRSLAQHHFLQAPRWNSLEEADRAFDEIDRQLGREFSDSGTSYSAMAEDWQAADELVTLGGQTDLLAMRRAYMGMLAHLPARPGAVAAMVREVEKAAPSGPERAAYLSALATGSATLAAHFATTQTLELLKNLT